MTRFLRLAADIHIGTVPGNGCVTKTRLAGVFLGKLVGVVGLYAPGGRKVAVIGVNGEKEIRLRQIRQLSSALERYIRVVMPGIENFSAQALLDQIAETRNDIQDQ